MIYPQLLSHPQCESCAHRVRFDRCWSWGPIAQGALRPTLMIPLPPPFDNHLRVPERVEEFSIQQLVPHCPVDAIEWRGETGTIRPAIVIVRKIGRGRTRSDVTLFGRESNR